jgi:hypothetical protein
VIRAFEALASRMGKSMGKRKRPRCGSAAEFFACFFEKSDLEKLILCGKDRFWGWSFLGV